VAHLLNVETVTVSLAARTLLDQVSLGVDDGDRIGVVGRNGDGKSTLLRVLTKRQEPDSGRVTHSRGLRVGFLSQSDEVPPGSVREAVLGAQRLAAGEHTWAGDPAVRAVLVGLLADIETDVPGGLDAPVSALSGGQRRRVALAGVLLGDHDLVVLDEPTNHLDVTGVAWLAAHLGARWPSGRGALLVVTHDRWFLDEVATQVWEVHDGIVEGYQGGYAAFVLARAERARVSAARAQRRENLLRKELAWLRRGAPARTSKPQFRLDAAAALIADEPPPRNSVELIRTAMTRLGKDVLDVENVSYRVREAGRERTLLDGVTWRLGPGDRIGVLGANGSGKTTLLGLLTGRLHPDSGRVKRGKTVRIGVLSQTLDELDEVGELRVVEALQREKGTAQVGGRELSAGDVVERLGLTGGRVGARVNELSGGERRRLQLVRLLVHEPNVLLLDEPSNDLDTDTLASVEDVMDSFGGTLIVVSHDRYLLERMTDRQVGLFGDGALRDLPGGVDEFLALAAARRGSGPGRQPGREPGGDCGRGWGAGSSRVGAERGSSAGRSTGEAAAAAEQRAARKEMARLERVLNRLTTREAALHERMAAAASDYQALRELDTELREVIAQRQTLEEEWLAAAEAAE
jgi:ATPase subunit of ABC transporter with duplicated ATPase domains